MESMISNKTDGVSPEEIADAQAIIEHAMSGKSLAPEVARRVRERGARIREEVFRQHGLLDVGVPAIRELRDSE
jgi:hypothetical protein